jgi:hypothetical protein
MLNVHVSPSVHMVFVRHKLELIMRHPMSTRAYEHMSCRALSSFIFISDRNVDNDSELETNMETSI